MVAGLSRLIAAGCAILLLQSSWGADVRLKDLGHFSGWRDNMLVGYGVVTGLAGSGDSPRNRVTRQALSNALAQLGMTIPQEQMQSRNVAAVLISATLPPGANPGDRIDVTVTSIGDARSLAGGALLVTPLLGLDHNAYAVAQGSVSVGGYRFDANQNLEQKNYPTVGLIPQGATIEAGVSAKLLDGNGMLTFVLKNADSTTSERVADQINRYYQSAIAAPRDASAIVIRVPSNIPNLNEFISTIEVLRVAPDQAARVVINERTGTVVAGGDVEVSAVSIAQGDIKISVTTEFSASQPSYLGVTGPETRSLVISNSKLSVDDSASDAVVKFPSTTVADMVQGLNKLRVSTRDIIAILQAVKAAGALYGDIIIQ